MTARVRSVTKRVDRILDILDVGLQDTTPEHYGNDAHPTVCTEWHGVWIGTSGVVAFDFTGTRVAWEIT